MNDTNLFKHAPKELVTDAFITWLLYFLDNNVKYTKEKEDFFADLLLAPQDFGKKISKIYVIRQDKKRHGRSDLILEFMLDNEKKIILFENKTWTSTSFKQLNGYKEDNPDLYQYIYLKLAYINYEEIKLTKQCGYKIIDVHKFHEALSKIKKLHPFISQYFEYITHTFLNFIDNLPIELYQNNNQNLLWHSQSQQFVISDIYKKLEGKSNYLFFKTGSSFGRPWTEIDFCKKDKVFGGATEYIFWRIDIRSGNFYIRLNQWAGIDKGFAKDKYVRRDKLRGIALEISKEYDLFPGKLSNRGLKESELIIFFLNNNRMDKLVKLLPDFSVEFMNIYKNSFG